MLNKIGDWCEKHEYAVSFIGATVSTIFLYLVGR